MQFWQVSFTGQYRYDECGVSGFLVRYSKQSGKTKLVVIDVGCSTGVAIKECQSRLQDLDVPITLYTIGCDISEKVKRQAESNLDEFVGCSVSDMCQNWDGEHPDVVICVNTIRYVEGPARANVLRDCCNLLKYDGALITDAGGYEACGRRRQPLKSTFTTLDNKLPESVYDGMRKLSSRFCRIFHPLEAFMVGKNDGLSHAEQIRSEWDQLPECVRRSIKHRLKRGRVFWRVLYSLWCWKPRASQHVSI